MLLNGRAVFAQKALTLDEILKEIELHNPSLASYNTLIKSEDAKVAGARAWSAPMVGAGTFMTPYPGGAKSEDNKGSFMISAEQDIPNPAKTKARKEYLETQSKTFFYGRTARFNELRAQARQLYFNLLIAEKKYRLQNENKQIMLNMKKLAEIRYPYNKGSLSEIFTAEGHTYEAENMLLMTEGEIRSRKIALNTLMNRNSADALQVDTLYSVSYNPVAALDTAYFSETRSDVLHMQHDIHAIEANIKAVRQEARPDFRLRFDHMSNYSALMPAQFTFMGMVSIPIAPWSAKSYRSEVKSLSLQMQAMQQQKEAMLNEMLGMARAMENDISVMQKQVGNYENKIIPTLRKALNTSILSYQENKGDLNQVIDAWQGLNMAQMNYLGQLQKYYQMIADYEKTLER